MIHHYSNSMRIECEPNRGPHRGGISLFLCRYLQWDCAGETIAEAERHVGAIGLMSRLVGS
jgi:hypothetical protein